MKRLSTVSLMLILVLSLFSCEEPTVPVSGITLNSETLTLTEGESFKLSATVSPSTATDKTVIWNSSNANVASVENGVVTAVAAGFATITATSASSGIKANCAVTVSTKVIDVLSITLSQAEAEMTVGEKATIIATIKPDNATDKTVTWSSSDESVATVNSMGIITAISGGQAAITASAGNKTASCLVSVRGFSKYLTFLSEGTTTISLQTTVGKTPLLYYSTDAVNWTQWNCSNLTFTSGAPLYLCGNNPQGISSGEYDEFHVRTFTRHSKFITTGDLFEISGDIMSLISYKKDVDIIPTVLCFYSLFSGCKNLTVGPDLSAKTLTDGCYDSMFLDCSSLTAAPELPSNSLAYSCYCKMFSRCTSLSCAPDLPATLLAERCYAGMLGGTNLTIAPTLPATSLAKACYQSMFDGCTRLTSAPVLPATTLAEQCYFSMFSNCSSLTVAPELKATALVERCYYAMFEGCTSLNYIKCLAADINAERCVDEWLSGVSITGTFVKAEFMNDWTRGPSGIPEGWTVVDEK
jgi:hypothetical protein